MVIKGLISLALAIVSISMCNAYTIATNDSLEVAAEDLDGDTLVDMATTTNTTLLEMLGIAIENLEAKLERELCVSIPCMQWSEWSKCSATMVDTFGVQMRVRNCTYGTPDSCQSPDTGENQLETEQESQFCPGGVASEEAASILPCPEEFTTTKHGFCLLLVNEPKSPIDAEQNCQSYGGHLMNIDTKLRWEDWGQVVGSYMNKARILIDGSRTSTKEIWRFASGVNPTVNGAAQGNAGDNLCREVFLSKMRGRNCSSTFKAPSVCEIRKTMSKQKAQEKQVLEDKAAAKNNNW